MEKKRAGERVALDDAELARWRPRVEALLARLDTAAAESALPLEPPNEVEAREWLLSVRRERFR